jgi:hypothetical protein
MQKRMIKEVENNNNNNNKSFLEYIKAQHIKKLEPTILHNIHGEEVKIGGGKLYPDDELIKQFAIDDPNFPWSNTESMYMLEYLRNKMIQSTEKEIKDIPIEDQDMLNSVFFKFQQYWNSYYEISEHTKEMRRIEWQKECEEEKKSRMLDPIRYYAEQIRNEEDYYSLTLEEKEAWDKESWDYRIELSDQEIAERKAVHGGIKKKEGMSDEEYKKLRNREYRRKTIQDNKQHKADRAIKEKTPWNILYHKLWSISCRCTAEEMRQGIFCETCILLKKVDNYMLDLFKNAAEGRSSIV